MKRSPQGHLRRHPAWEAAAAGFSLIELMVVVAIMGIVMTIAIPSIYRQLHPESMRKAVEDFTDAFTQARASAILDDVVMEVQIRPFDRTIRVVPAGTASISPLFSEDVSGKIWRRKDLEDAEGSGVSGLGSSGAGYSAKLSDRIGIEMIDINFIEYKDADLAQVRFYPNGTSDECTIILTNDRNEWRKIALEVVTGFADVDTDPAKWLR